MFITTLNRNRRNTLDDLFNEWDNIFSNTNNHYSSDYSTSSDDDGVTLTMNVPGYNKKLINVSVSGDRLVVEGKSNSGDTNGFKKVFTIEDTLDADGVEATVVDGVLTVSVPYVEEVKPRNIEVKVK
jgi:HSP20 family protein